MAPVHPNSFAVLRLPNATHPLAAREPGGSPAQETGVALQGQWGRRALVFGDERDSTLPDYKLTSVERMFAAARLDHGHASVK